MPKRATAFQLMLSARDPETPAYRWIYGALRTEILEGRLRPGSRLPSSRDLALPYRLSRAIVTAFEQLKSEAISKGRSVRGAMSVSFTGTTTAGGNRQGGDPFGLASEAALHGWRPFGVQGRSPASAGKGHWYVSRWLLAWLLILQAARLTKKIESPNERASTLTRMKQMNRTASFSRHICET
jgi:regulatory GntR family protein